MDCYELDFTKLSSYKSRFFGHSTSKLAHPDTYSELIKRANLLLENKVIYTDAMDMEACSTPYSITSYQWNSFPADDPEWLFMLSRHGFLLDLAMSYYFTEDEKYAQKWRQLVLSFITENGDPSGKETTSWRPLDAGLRLTNWIKSLTYLEITNLLNAEELALFEKNIGIHLNYLHASFIDKYRLSNWGVLAVSGMAAAYFFIQSNCFRKEEYTWIWQRLEEQLHLQFDDTGIHWEQSPLYQHQVIFSYLYLLQLAESLGAEIPIDLRDKLKEPIKASFYQADSNDQLNPLNDSDAISFSYVYNCYRQMGFLPKEHDVASVFIYIGCKYKKTISILKTMPALFSSYQSGFGAIKTPALYFTLSNGLHGSSHGHATTGSFTFQIGNRPIVMDSGRYTYTECSLRLALKKQAAHNTLFPKNEAITTITGSWSYKKLPEPLFQYIKTFEEGFYAECCWKGIDNQHKLIIFERKFIYLTDAAILIVIDNCQSENEQTYIASFNLSDRLSNIKNEPDQLIFKDANGAVTYWSDSGEIDLEDAIHSKIYNQQGKHLRIIDEFKAKNGIANKISVFTTNPKISIQTLTIKQANDSLTFTDAKGIQITLPDHTNYAIYHSFDDIVKGNKLLQSELGHYFYGSVVLVNNNGIQRRLK